jgi:hypothetical protein
VVRSKAMHDRCATGGKEIATVASWEGTKSTAKFGDEPGASGKCQVTRSTEGYMPVRPSSGQVRLLEDTVLYNKIKSHSREGNQDQLDDDSILSVTDSSGNI